jgi:hypothetical protein
VGFSATGKRRLRAAHTHFRHSRFSLETGRWPAQVGKLMLKSGHIDSKDIAIQSMIETIKERGSIYRSYRFSSATGAGAHHGRLCYPARPD